MTSSLALFFLQAGADAGFFNVLVEKFNEGGDFMWPVLVALVLGLAIFLERIITLNLADINKKICPRSTTGTPGGWDSRCSGTLCHNERPSSLCIPSRLDES